MNKYTKILLATTLFGLGLAAQAELRTEASVTVPFNFVVSGKTLPPGTYKVSRIADDPRSVQLIAGRENNDAVYVNPVEAESTDSNKTQVSFQQVGKQFFLSSIQTPNEVYNFHVPRSVNREAAARSSNNVSISGGPASN